VDSKPDPTPRLQFESAIESTESGEPAESAGERPAQAVVTCGACQSAIPDAYFDVNGTTVCGSCHAEIARQAATPRGLGTLALATVFGIGAAIAGAALYYAVIAITNFEIGLVAIAIGYMVGFAVRKGAGGGGRRFQIVAILLTYWAVGLAYVPLAFSDRSASRREQAQAEKTGAAVAEPADGNRDDGGARRIGFLFALAMLFGFTFVLPALAIVGSMPSGLISAAIIAFGMRQAWRMTGAPQLVMTGPYQISSNPSSAS
jgi:hypothetical protein